MAPFQRILMATDTSPPAQTALEVAVAMATRFAAKLVLLYVVEETAHSFPFPLRRGIRENAAACLDSLVAGLRGRMVDATGMLREGLASYEICAGVEDAGADLVVVGSHGRRGFRRFVLGSVAEQVVRACPVPVLTVHASTQPAVLAGGMDAFRRILAPTDLSEASRESLGLAIRMAIELDAGLAVVHVREPMAAQCDSPAESEAQARDRLDELLAEVRVRVPRATGVLRHGVVSAEILGAAEESRADLVVLGSRERHGVQRAWSGIAEKIVRLAPIPVIAMREG